MTSNKFDLPQSSRHKKQKKTHFTFPKNISILKLYFQPPSHMTSFVSALSRVKYFLLESKFRRKLLHFTHIININFFDFKSGQRFTKKYYRGYLSTSRISPDEWTKSGKSLYWRKVYHPLYSHQSDF